MSKIRRATAIITALCVCLCAAYPAAARAAAPDAGEAERYDGYLVSCPDPPPAGGARGALLASRSAALEYVAGDVYWTRSEEYARRLLDAGQADFIEPNYIATLFDASLLQTDWPRETVRADCAESLGLDGTGVRVAVIDSGVDPGNPDLTNAVIGEGYDYLNETAKMSDDVYHGTQVAQLICGDDNGLGVTGIARGCTLVPLRCFAAVTGGDVRTLTRAVTDAATVYRCDVINMSWGLEEDSTVLHQALQKAYLAGVTLVAASGNVSSSVPQGTLVYPAAYDETISVGSLDASQRIAFDSIQNDAVTVCAPGKGIGLVSAGGGAVSASGTSFAAPCVTAALALMKQFAPGLRGEDCAALLRARAVDLGEAGYDPAYGYGLVRLDRLFDASWARVDTGGDGPVLAASLLRQGDGAVLLACYDARGRLCGARVFRLAEHFAAARWTLPAQAASCAAFFADGGLAPLCAPARFTLPADG